MSWCEIREMGAPKRVLVLQGGGALGSNQAGVYEALDGACFLPDWMAGTSIGAINGALIAGNRPEDRLPVMRSFWEQVTGGLSVEGDAPGRGLTALWHQWAAGWAVVHGAPGFFKPHWPPVLPWLAGPLGMYAHGRCARRWSGWWTGICSTRAVCG